jgi:hypothetical protein
MGENALHTFRMVAWGMVDPDDPAFVGTTRRKIMLRQIRLVLSSTGHYLHVGMRGRSKAPWYSLYRCESEQQRDDYKNFVVPVARLEAICLRLLDDVERALTKP